jgi:hypothetical protein
VEADTLIKVGQLSRFVSSDRAGPAPELKKAQNSDRGERRVSVNIDGVEAGVLPSFMSPYAGEARQRSAKAYPLLSLIEQSIRELISRVLWAKYGDDWWNNAVDPAIRKKAEGRQRDDDLDPWHTPRGDHPLFYLDIRDYVEIIVDDSNWPLFEPILDRSEFVTETLREINVSRRVVAHMNALNKHDFERLSTTFRKWMKHLKARESNLPEKPRR